MNTKICEHGQLKRSCGICFLKDELRAVSDALGDPASEMLVPLADSIKEVKAAVQQLLDWMHATDLYQFGRGYPKEAAVLERVFGKDIL